MTEDDLRKALQDVKTMQATQGESLEALHQKLDVLIAQRDRSADRLEIQEQRLTEAETGWVNSFRDQAQRITALESRLSALETNR